jgi:predicted anti-sigma-YlaC factor YlaD
MACAGFEKLIAAYVEGDLTGQSLQRAEEHLAQCVECRAFSQQLRQLDLALARGLKAPALSADFEARLWQRIEQETEAEGLAAAEREERRQQLEAEYAAQAAKLRKRCSVYLGVLDGAGYAVAALVAAYLVLNGLNWGIAGGSSTGLSAAQMTGAAAVAGVLSALTGVSFAFRQQAARLWAAFWARSTP